MYGQSWKTGGNASNAPAIGHAHDKANRMTRSANKTQALDMVPAPFGRAEVPARQAQGYDLAGIAYSVRGIKFDVPR